jgi:uncharacterized protein YfaS (alpha-2-macroglobulin family)
VSCQEISVGDVGVALDFTVTDEDGDAIDLSLATLLRYRITKQDGTLLTKTPSFVTDGTDGQLRYSTQTGDIDQAGLWRIQAYVEVSGLKLSTDIHTFRVRAYLE